MLKKINTSFTFVYKARYAVSLVSIIFCFICNKTRLF